MSFVFWVEECGVMDGESGDIGQVRLDE